MAPVNTFGYKSSRSNTVNLFLSVTLITKRFEFDSGADFFQTWRALLAGFPRFPPKPNLIVDDVVYGIGRGSRGCLNPPWIRGAPGPRPYPIEYFFDIQYHLYRLHVIYLPDRRMRTKKIFRFCHPVGLVRSL